MTALRKIPNAVSCLALLCMGRVLPHFHGRLS
jgi:hypothetical protein